MITTSTHKAGTSAKQPPAGTRPPAPPWAKIIAWLILLLCLGLWAGREPLLDWAAQQPEVTLSSESRITEPPGLARLTAMSATLIQRLFTAPMIRIIQGVGALGLAIIGLELSLAALTLVAQTTLHRFQRITVMRVRLPQPTISRSTAADTGADLFRALHQQLPASGVWLGQAPWLALTLSAQPDEAVEFGLVIAGGTATQRQSWATALRKTLQGLAPDAVIEECPDTLARACRPGQIAVWREWQLALPPAYPLRLVDDRLAGDLLGPLVAALQPRQGVTAEVQLVLQPRHDDVHLARDWRAAALRRLLRLKGRAEYALTPDAPTLEAKLQGPVYHTTLRAVTIAAADDARAAHAELQEIAAVIGQYAARNGSRLQRWIPADNRTLRYAEPPRWAREIRGVALAWIIGGLVAGASFPVNGMVLSFITAHAGIWPILSLPLPITAFLPAILTNLLTLLAGLAVFWGMSCAVGHPTTSRIQRLLARTPRAVPPPGLLWGSAWRGPAILGPDELAGLWHLPTPALGCLARWLPCRYLPPPPHAFVPPEHGAAGNPPARLVIGYGRHRDGSEAPVGLPLRDARQGIAFTAPPGVGKTQLASNLADQLRPCGYALIDGKGDDAGNLVETMRQRIPLEDEDRLVVLDVLDADWPIGLNPLAGVDAQDSGAVDQVLGQIEAIFARLDPDTWSKAPRMKNYLRKATLLVLAGEAQPTIAHVKQALLDETYRRTLLPHCANVEVVDFWTVEFPQIGEQQRASRDALVSRFDMLLDSELTRYLFNQITPALSFQDAIAGRWIVLAPLPHRTLGGLAGPVGMLLFQALLRAAFRRPGSDLTRPEYGFIGDEFQVLVENCDTKDVRDALTQVRSFGMITIIANQLHAQLGDLADYALTAIANRILLRTQEPDATLYARHYAESGVTAADISGQEPREHQYAWIGVDGRLTRLFSMRPLPWQPPLANDTPAYSGPAWRNVLPESSPTPAFDREVCRLMHAELGDETAIATALAGATDEQWTWLIQRWDALRDAQRQYILRHPGCIPERQERQRWLSRLRAARRRVLAMAEYGRIRRAVAPENEARDRRARQTEARPASALHGTTPSSDAPVTQQPHFIELERREPPRLARVEPSDALLDSGIAHTTEERP